MAFRTDTPLGSIYHNKLSLISSKTKLSTLSNGLFLDFDSGVYRTQINLELNKITASLDSKMGFYLTQNISNNLREAGFYRERVSNSESNGLFLTNNAVDGEITLLKHSGVDFLIFEDDRFNLKVNNHTKIDYFETSKQLTFSNQIDNELILYNSGILSRSGSSNIKIEPDQVELKSSSLSFGSGGSLIGFFGATPVSQPTATGSTAGFASGSGTNITVDATFTGGLGTTAFTVDDIVRKFKEMGLFKL